MLFLVRGRGIAEGSATDFVADVTDVTDVIGLEFRVRSHFLPVFGVDRICECYDRIYDSSPVNNPADFWEFVHYK